MSVRYPDSVRAAKIRSALVLLLSLSRPLWLTATSIASRPAATAGTGMDFDSLTFTRIPKASSVVEILEHGSSATAAASKRRSLADRIRSPSPSFVTPEPENDEAPLPSPAPSDSRRSPALAKRLRSLSPDPAPAEPDPIPNPDPDPVPVVLPMSPAPTPVPALAPLDKRTIMLFGDLFAEAQDVSQEWASHADQLRTERAMLEAGEPEPKRRKIDHPAPPLMTKTPLPTALNPVASTAASSAPSSGLEAQSVFPQTTSGFKMPSSAAPFAGLAAAGTKRSFAQMEQGDRSASATTTSAPPSQPTSSAAPKPAAGTVPARPPVPSSDEKPATIPPQQPTPATKPEIPVSPSRSSDPMARRAILPVHPHSPQTQAPRMKPAKSETPLDIQVKSEPEDDVPLSIPQLAKKPPRATVPAPASGSGTNVHPPPPVSGATLPLRPPAPVSSAAVPLRPPAPLPAPVSSATVTLSASMSSVTAPLRPPAVPPAPAPTPGDESPEERLRQKILASRARRSSTGVKPPQRTPPSADAPAFDSTSSSTSTTANPLPAVRPYADRIRLSPPVEPAAMAPVANTRTHPKPFKTRTSAGLPPAPQSAGLPPKPLATGPPPKSAVSAAAPTPDARPAPAGPVKSVVAATTAAAAATMPDVSSSSRPPPRTWAEFAGHPMGTTRDAPDSGNTRSASSSSAPAGRTRAADAGPATSAAVSSNKPTAPIPQPAPVTRDAARQPAGAPSTLAAGGSSTLPPQDAQGKKQASEQRQPAPAHQPAPGAQRATPTPTPKPLKSILKKPSPAFQQRPLPASLLTTRSHPLSAQYSPPAAPHPPTPPPPPESPRVPKLLGRITDGKRAPSDELDEDRLAKRMRVAAPPASLADRVAAPSIFERFGDADGYGYGHADDDEFEDERYHRRRERERSPSPRRRQADTYRPQEERRARTPEVYEHPLPPAPVVAHPHASGSTRGGRGRGRGRGGGGASPPPLRHEPYPSSAERGRGGGKNRGRGNGRGRGQGGPSPRGGPVAGRGKKPTMLQRMGGA